MSNQGALSDQNLNRLLVLNAAAMPIAGVAAVVARPDLSAAAAFPVGALLAGLAIWTGVGALGLYRLLAGPADEELPVLEEVKALPVERESQIAA